MSESKPDENHWHLDKKVPITLVVMILLQLVVFLLFAGRMMQRDDEQERRLSSLEAKDMTTRVGVIESRLSDVRDVVKEINANVNRLIEAKAKQ